MACCRQNHPVSHCDVARRGIRADEADAPVDQVRACLGRQPRCVRRPPVIRLFVVTVPSEVDQCRVVALERVAGRGFSLLQIGARGKLAGLQRESAQVEDQIGGDEPPNRNAVDRLIAERVDRVCGRIRVGSRVLAERQRLQEVAVSFVRPRVTVDLDRWMARKAGHSGADRR